MTEGKRDEFERVGELYEGLPDPRAESKEAARAALVARFEAAEREAQSVQPGHPLLRGTARIAQAFNRLRAFRILAAGGCAAALVAATIIVTSGDVATRAYAVEPQPSGLVFVSINSLEDGEGLQQSLRDAGVPAVIAFNDEPRRPLLSGRNEFPPGFRNVIPARDELSNGACTARIPVPGRAPGSDITVELPYPESLGYLAGLDPSLRPTLQTSFEEVRENVLPEAKRTLSPKAFQRVLRLERKRGRLERAGKLPKYPGAGAETARAEKLKLPPFTFVPTEDLVPPTEEEGVTFIIDPSGLEADERLHIVTTGGSLQSMTAYSRNAICIASGGEK